MSDSGQRITSLPVQPPPAAEEPPNPARSVQAFVGGIMETAMAPVDALNLGLAKATLDLVRILPKFPAARLFGDLVFGWPHAHLHPPNLIPPAPPIPLPSVGPVICAGAMSVLINGLPAARTGDVGFGAWCGGFFPIFEVQTGSSHVFIGGARPARMLIDFTRHCMPGTPGFNKLGAAMMAFSAGMGGLGVAASLIDQSNAEAAAEAADTESAAAAAEASAAAAGLGAAVGAVQIAADLAAAALQMMMGKDPAAPPGIPLGNFITGSPNVVIGGFPMPGWMMILKGLGKLLRPLALKGAKRLGLNGGCGKLFEPIDVVTGANVDDFTDFALPAQRFAWRRWYNSQQTPSTPLGWGFRHEYQLELEFDDAADRYTYTDQEGRTVPFPPFLTEAPGERVVQHGYVLTRLSKRRYELTAPYRPAIVFEFRELPGLAKPAALRDADRNFAFEYDGEARLVQILIDEERTVRFAYSPAGLLGAVSLEERGREAVEVAGYRYDDDGCLVEFRDALGQVARYQYDQARRMTRKTDRRGYSYHYRYDEQSRCVYTGGDDGMYEGWLEYHPEDQATLVTYSDGGRWTYEYNQLGTITKIVDPYGGERHRIVDPETGLVTREIDPAGNPTELLYDEQGAHTGRRDPLGYWAPPREVEPDPPDPLEHRVPETPLEWEFGHLIDPQAIRAVSPEDPLLSDFPEVAAELARLEPAAGERRALPREQHDLLGRLIERQQADGSIERWEYDAEGNETLYVDGDGGTHRQEYTSWNQLQRETDPAGNTRSFRYSPTERLTRLVDPGGTVHDFAYDRRCRLVEVHRNGLLYESYRYDEADNLVEKLDGEGRSLMVCEPGFGRVDRTRRLADGEVYRYEYNSRGQVIRARTNRDRLVLDYDEDGRSTRDQRNGLGVEHEFVAGRLVYTAVFGKAVIVYEHRHDGLFITDPTGRRHVFQLADDGLIVKRLANGTRELVQYDADGRCLRKVAVSANGARRSQRYRYSAAGDLLQVEDDRRGRTTYHCDAAHRLKVAEREDGKNELYAHDRAGNLVLQPGLNGVQIGSGNRLKQANGERFQYDHRDNVVRREGERASTRYEYDSFDQLSGIWSEGRAWRADYDAFGRRIRTHWLDRTTRYFWDRDRLAAEIGPDGGVRVYVYADEHALVPFLYVDYRSLEAEPESGTVKYLFTNHLGVPERVEDESGQTIWQGEVSPYGTVRTELGNRNEINLRFPGHYYDRETGLHYNRFRYYDPALGRYLQCDPLGLAGGYNLYAYPVNPLTGVDILGLTQHDHGDLPEPQRPRGPMRPNHTGAEMGGSRPRPGERSMTREQWRAQSAATRGAGRYPRPTAASDHAADHLAAQLRAAGYTGGGANGIAVLAITHSDGHVTYALSGGSRRVGNQYTQLQNHLGPNYSPASAQTPAFSPPLRPYMGPDGVIYPGRTTCAEPRGYTSAQQYAQQNNAPVTGATVRWLGRGNPPSPNPYPSQRGGTDMCPCGSCSVNSYRWL